jgi:UDP-N-acetylmuramate dehydrogenase
MLTIYNHVDLTTKNTLHLTATATNFTTLTETSQLSTLTKLLDNYPRFFILGGGSNLILPPVYSGLVIYNQLKGIQISDLDDKHYLVSAMAGETWDNFVEHTIAQGAYGLENLSLIPGTVGASPVQNIGAYGVEVKDFIEFVEVFDLATGKQFRLTNAQCQFSYRNSLFKQQPTWLICQVGFKLLKTPSLNLNYSEVNKHLAGNLQPTAADLRQVIIAIRSAKLPDPAFIGNAGSFFHNPILPVAAVTKLKTEYPELPTYPTANSELVKVSAGWLIDKLGLKGYRQGNLGVYAKQALVLVNHGAATQDELLAFAKVIQAKVAAAYHVQLNIEPIIICA